MRDIVERQRVDVPVTTNPLAEAVGMTILAAAEGEVRARFSVDRRFTQGNGVVSALLDFGMAFAAFSAIPPGTTIATVSQTTSYLRAGLAGEFVVEAMLEKVGRTLIHARATLTQDGKAVASATAPIAVIPTRAGTAPA